jgi:hypothetical protein
MSPGTNQGSGDFQLGGKHVTVIQHKFQLNHEPYRPEQYDVYRATNFTDKTEVTK